MDKFYEKDGSDKKEIEEIEKQISVLDKKIRSVRMKYALEEIDEPTCRDAVEELEARKNEVFGLFRSISSDYEAATNEKQDKSCDLSCLVAGGGLEPPASGL